MSQQVGHLSSETRDSSIFNKDFWRRTLRELGYPIVEQQLDIKALKDQGAISSALNFSDATRFYVDDYVEVVVLTYAEGERMTRGQCTRTARSWKERRLIRPLLIFTDGSESYAVSIPGAGTGGEVRVLSLADRLYRTDIEVLESLAYPGGPEELRRHYDETFIPYEKVRDEFFEGYRDLYQKIQQAVRKYLPSQSAAYAQRFLGRLMFLYFLQRKGWLKGDKKFVDSISNYMELNRLFYEGLNRPGTPGLPFLNGSLFEREEYMTAEVEEKLAGVMDPLFRDAREFFDKYNFTVDETAPLEVEASIDPALIGTVFENMLPEYERGSKGTFYTPRSESSFICRRALAAYLGCGDRVSEDGKKFIDGLNACLEELRRNKNEREVREFKDRLLSIKVLDPAVGSGGFLLAMMQEIIGLLQEADSAVGWRTDVQEYKKRILPNLYGFDIEAEAVEIAKLRLWLSLIIDQREPEPLPNLDMNLIVIDDSLRQSVGQTSLDPEVQSLQLEFSELRRSYMDTHDPNTKNVLRQRLQKLSEEIRKRTGEDPNVIEAHMHDKADIVVMNPPYVRQESIEQRKKEYYSAKYGIDKKSDLYAYFLIRALRLVSDAGVVSVISSDKWLETGYGESVQEKLKEHLIAVYGQRERSFGADINTVVTVLKKKGLGNFIDFVYLDSYTKDDVRQHIRIERKELNPGKWFYLRPGAKFFIEKLLPKLTHKLGDFAEIKFGIKTGANEFFYMKDVSHLFEADRLANPKKFEEWGVKAKTRKELEEQGLIYIENEGGERFVIDRKDVQAVIRTPQELDSYIIKNTSWLVFKPNPQNKPGIYSRNYIKWGEKQEIAIKKGRSKGEKVLGYNNLSTVKGHRPNWFNIPDLSPAQIIPNRFIKERHFVSLSLEPILASDACALVYPRGKYLERVWAYMNSTVYYLSEELLALRQGGGGAPLEILAGEYERFPCFDIVKIPGEEDLIKLLDREVLGYLQELKQDERRKLDIKILLAMGFGTDEVEAVLNQLYDNYIDAVQDRLIKAGKNFVNNIKLKPPNEETINRSDTSI